MMAPLPPQTPPQKTDNALTRAFNFVRQHGAAIGAGAGAVILLVAGVMLFIFGDETPPPRRVEFTIVNIVPPPPPPPPPPQPEKPPEPEMIEQQPIVEPEIKEEAKVEEPKEAPPIDTDAPPPGPLGPGSDLPVGPGNSPFAPGGGGGGGGGGGSRWGWYAAIVQQQMEAALRAHPKTRNSIARVQVRLWADKSGRISRIQLVSSTGDPEVDAAINNEAFAGITLREPPPSDMPMPVITRITLRRPG